MTPLQMLESSFGVTPQQRSSMEHYMRGRREAVRWDNRTSLRQRARFTCACGQVIIRAAQGRPQRMCLECECVRRLLGQKCQSAVAVLIRAGELQPAHACKCVDCGNPASQYDHRDYFRPKDVVPVCRSCNAYRGHGEPWKSAFAKIPLTRVPLPNKRLARTVTYSKTNGKRR